MLREAVTESRVQGTRRLPGEMPTLDVGTGRTAQDECRLSTKHVSQPAKGGLRAPQRMPRAA